MKPKTGFQLVQAVLFMLAMMCGALLLSLGSGVVDRAECFSSNAHGAAPSMSWLSLTSSQSCAE
jgi:hypothetical protein